MEGIVCRICQLLFGNSKAGSAVEREQRWSTKLRVNEEKVLCLSALCVRVAQPRP